MNLYAKLCEREAQGKRLRAGLIGAGKFGAMYLAQVPKTPGLHLAGIADLSPANAKLGIKAMPPDWLNWEKSNSTSSRRLKNLRQNCGNGFPIMQHFPTKFTFWNPQKYHRCCAWDRQWLIIT